MSISGRYRVESNHLIKGDTMILIGSTLYNIILKSYVYIEFE